MIILIILNSTLILTLTRALTHALFILFSLKKIDFSSKKRARIRVESKLGKIEEIFMDFFVSKMIIYIFLI